MIKDKILQNKSSFCWSADVNEKRVCHKGRADMLGVAIGSSAAMM